MSIESPGVRALKDVTFSGVTLPDINAISRIRDKATGVIEGNLDSEISFRRKHLPKTESTVNGIRNFEADRRNVVYTHPLMGLEMSSAHLDTIHHKEERGIFTFEEEIDLLFSVEEAKIQRLSLQREQDKLPETREGTFSSIIFVGNLLDRLRIIDPAKASFDDGVAIIVERMRGSEFIDPAMMGVMIYDTISRTVPKYREKYERADREGANKLKETLVQHMTAEEATGFMKGLFERWQQNVAERSRLRAGRVAKSSPLAYVIKNEELQEFEIEQQSMN